MTATPDITDGPDTVLGALRALRRGRTDPVTLAEAALRAASGHASRNAVATLLADDALARARTLAGHRDPVGPLHGIPVTVKDLFAVRGAVLRAGSRAPMPDVGAGEACDATAVARLRAAGAVVLATTNMVEIAMGITGENAVTGDVGNAHDPARQAGGSSSGSAVAVAVGAGLASLGTDTAGSVRIPAAFNGTVGVKPTHGLVPLDGALALSPTCDHAGPLTRTVADARLVLSVLAARDIAARPVTAPRLGVPWRFLDGRLGAEVRRRFEEFVEGLRRGGGGATVVDATLPDVDALLATYNPLTRPEAARVHRAALDRDPDVFQPVVRDALLEGLRFTAQDYLAARDARRAARGVLDRELRSLDAVLLPTAPLPAPPRGATEVDVESGRLAHRAAFLPFTAPFSMTGVPAVTVPWTTVDGLPVGVQVVGAAGTDAALLDVAAWIETRIRAEGR